MKKTILILGGDGYFGWPLALKIAVKHPDQKIFILDNEWRRNTVASSGFQTLVPIAKPKERIKAFQDIYGQDNLHYIKMDVNSANLEEIIENEKPHTIFHLAQQCSAPYSMKGIEEALYTINNNESGNMRLLWAVRKHVPDAHIIKLGSFGEYAQGGIDIAEGYFLMYHSLTALLLPFVRLTFLILWPDVCLLAQALQRGRHCLQQLMHYRHIVWVSHNNLLREAFLRRIQSFCRLSEIRRRMVLSSRSALHHERQM